MKLRSWLMALVLSLAFAPAASAAMLTLDSSGILRGATGVDVGGTLYDVVFVDTTCIDAFSGCDSNTDFTFDTLSAAETASQALLDQVLRDVSTGNFDSDTSLTFGCQGGLACGVWTPYQFTGVSFLSSIASNSSEFLGFDFDGVGVGASVTFADFATGSGDALAQWTRADAAPVPEPASLALLALGLAGLGVRRWRQRKAS